MKIFGILEISHCPEDSVEKMAAKGGGEGRRICAEELGYSVAFGSFLFWLRGKEVGERKRGERKTTFGLKK